MRFKSKLWVALCSVSVVGSCLAMESPVSVAQTTSLPEGGYLDESYPVSYTLYNRMSQAINNFEVTATGIDGTFTEETGCSALAAGASCLWKGNFTPTGSSSTHQARLVLSYWGEQVPVTQTIDANVAQPDPLYVAVGNYSFNVAPAVFTSGDAVSWTDSGVSITTVSGEEEEVAFNDVAYYNGLWVAPGERYVGSDDYRARVFTSTDGVGWAQKTLGHSSNAWAHAVVHGGSQWVAVGGSYTTASGSSALAFISTSPDGDTWTTQTMPQPSGSSREDLRAVAYGNGQWVAVGETKQGSNYHPLVYSSTDGVNWVSRTISADHVYLRDVTYADGKWVATGSNSTTDNYNQDVFTSTDAINWSAQTLPTGGSTIVRLDGVGYHEDANGGSHWVAVSQANNTTSNGKIFYSTDAQTWVERTFPGGVTKTSLYDVSYINNRWVAVGFNDNTDHSKSIIVSTDDDAETWTSITVTPDAGESTYFAIEAVASNR